jgi:hypothetical protein
MTNNKEHQTRLPAPAESYICMTPALVFCDFLIDFFSFFFFFKNGIWSHWKDAQMPAAGLERS